MFAAILLSMFLGSTKIPPINDFLDQATLEDNQKTDEVNDALSRLAEMNLKTADKMERSLNILIERGRKEDSSTIERMKKDIKKLRTQAEWFASNPLKTIELKKK